LLVHHAPAAVAHITDDGIIKNLVGRLNTTAVVKTTMTGCLNTLYRAAGIEVPREKPPQKSQLSKRPSKDDAKTPQTASTNDLIRKLTERVASRQHIISDDSDSDHTKVRLTRDSNSRSDDSDSDHIDHAKVRLSRDSTSRSSSPEPSRQTRLLPALSTGYIPPSDFSDPDEEYASFAPITKIRKNRRGQRERQSIWLKKYGSGARHLHPELKPPKPKDRGGNGGDVVPVAEVIKKVNDPHPSWVAKQKLREQQKVIMESAKSRKIVFE